MRKIAVVLFISLFSISTLSAQTGNSKKGKTESWYTYWGIGYANLNYPNELQDLLDYLKDQDGVSNISMSLDMLGFYWHVKPKTIAGFVINGAGDRYEVNSESMQINQYIYGVSVMHYPGRYFGNGIFLRADMGLAKIVVTDSDNNSTGSDNGFGFLLGSGYSFDLGGTRLLVNVNYAIRNVEGDGYKTLGISLGGLF
ncbi:MAG: hypothetical protein H6696_09500 [Deferribacteres bacterium]|nr:hypothetical protein [candidate division KSB1 bacterium]MCB9502162.1 hypothetical protein [Deferribacteres bacterium]